MIEAVQLLVAFGIFGFMVRVEGRLTRIETTCGLRKKNGECDRAGNEGVSDVAV